MDEPAWTVSKYQPKQVGRYVHTSARSASPKRHPTPTSETTRLPTSQTTKRERKEKKRKEKKRKETTQHNTAAGWPGQTETQTQAQTEKTGMHLRLHLHLHMYIVSYLLHTQTTCSTP
jgi:hypothetical protein